MKRTIQTSKPGMTFGIEHDHRSIRSARLSSDGRGGFKVDRLEVVNGNFAEDGELLEGLRKTKSLLNIGGRDSLVSCLSGKQVFASQFPFRKLAPEEMEQALRLELRKTVHFEVATSTLDFEIIEDDTGSNGDMPQVIVSMASNPILKRHLALLEKAGLKAIAVDVLPVAIANAIWASKEGEDSNHPLVALHIGPQVSTIVIDGEHSPFFNRNIYFAADDVFSPNASEEDRHKRIRSLTDEISRSLVFYEKNSQVTGFQEILLLGEYLNQELLIQQIRNATGVAARGLRLAEQLGSIRENTSGSFDLSVALALRGDA